MTLLLCTHLQNSWSTKKAPQETVRLAEREDCWNLVLPWKGSRRARRLGTSGCLAGILRYLGQSVTALKTVAAQRAGVTSKVNTKRLKMVKGA